MTIDSKAQPQQVTLYYKNRNLPNSGYVTRLFWFKGTMEKEYDTGKVVYVCGRRKHGKKDYAFGYGRNDDLVIVQGWQKEYDNYNTVTNGKVTTRVPRFSTATADEWNSDFEKFCQSLLASGVQVIEDYRGVTLGPVPLLGASKSTKPKPPAPPMPPMPPKPPAPPTPPVVVITPDEIYAEGAPATVVLDRYERNQNARRACIDHYGVTCRICEVDFAARYPEIGDGFIEVHHLNLLSAIGEAHVVDPIKDLLPVCPNCHSMLHRPRPPRPPLTPDQLREIMRGSGESDISGDGDEGGDNIPF